MPSRLYDWQVQIKAAEREYQAVRVALDMLGLATIEERHGLTGERGWDDLAAAEIYATERNLDATYLIRMYSTYERAVGSFWRRLPGNAYRRADGDVKLREVGYIQGMARDIINAAQLVRTHRNRLVHQRIEEHAEVMDIQDAKDAMLRYLNQLPAT